MSKMQKLRKGVWWSPTAASLKEYKAVDGNDFFLILAESEEQAHEKAKDWRKHYSLHCTQ